MAIPFTQYLRPHGKERKCTIVRPDDVEQAAAALVADRCRFEAEILTTGEVSLTCEIEVCSCCNRHDCQHTTARSWDLLAIAICPNGQEVPAAVDRMVAEATTKLAARKAVSP